MPQGLRHLPEGYIREKPEGRTINKPRAVNVFLLLSDGKALKLNTNEAGLVGMSLDRYLTNPSAQNTGVLQTLDITMYTKTTRDIVAYISENRSNLKIQYGFEDEELSPVYDLQILKVKTNKSEAGTMIALGAVGLEENRKFKAEIFQQNVKIEDILKIIAERNGWSLEVDCNLRTPKPLLKSENETDFEFITNKILPIANQAIIADTRSNTNTIFWELKLFKTGSEITLYFKPRNKGVRNRRVWSYEYGTSEHNSIINLTQELDMSYFLNGLKIQVSSNLVEQSMYTEESLIATINDMKDTIEDELIEAHKNYNIPMLNVEKFSWQVELVEDDGTNEEIITDLTYDSLRTRIVAAIDRAVSKVHTIELEVIGNPRILPTDLIELLVRDIDGNYDWLTAPGGASSYWRVIGIQENIGLNGYTTNLRLVREFMVE